MIQFGRNGCFAEIRVYQEYTVVDYNRLHERIKTSRPAEKSRESPGTPRATWIRRDASRILAVSHASDDKIIPSMQRFYASKYHENGEPR